MTVTHMLWHDLAKYVRVFFVLFCKPTDKNSRVESNIAFAISRYLNITTSSKVCSNCFARSAVQITNSARKICRTHHIHQNISLLLSKSLTF